MLLQLLWRAGRAARVVAFVCYVVALRGAGVLTPLVPWCSPVPPATYPAVADAR